MAEETKREMAVQSSGFMTMGMGDHVLVRQRDGSWKAGAIVDCYLTYTVMYEDGSHGTLDNKTFTLQRVVRAGTLAPGMNVLVPRESGDFTSLLAGVVTEVGDVVRVVVGEQGVDWAWSENGDRGITALHNSGVEASLAVLSRDKERTVRKEDVRGGTHWLRLVCEGGAEGLRVDDSVLFVPGGSAGAPGAVDDEENKEYGLLRWDVPGTNGGPEDFSPMLSGSDLLRSAATMFDLDGDGGLNAAEFNALQEAQFGVSALDHYDASEEVEEDVENVRVTPADMPALASSVGHSIGEGGALELSAIPHLWKVKASTRARNKAWRPQKRLCWELANVLVVRLGARLKPEQTVSVYEGRPERTPAEKLTKCLGSIPKLLQASNNPKFVAAAAVGVMAVKGAIMSAKGPAQEIVGMLREAIKEAIFRAPRIVMTFVETLTAAWNEAPELVGPFKEIVSNILADVKNVLGDAGAAVHAAIVGGLQLGSQFAVAAGEAARNGAAIASSLVMKAHGAFVSGVADKLGDMGGDLASMAGSTGAQVAAAMGAAMEQMKVFCSRETLENLADIATSLADDIRGILPTVGNLGMDVGGGASQGVEAMPPPEVDSESVTTEAKNAATEAAGAVGDAADDVKAAVKEAAVAAAGVVPLVAAQCEVAAAEMAKLFRIAAAMGKPIAAGARDAVLQVLRTGAAMGEDAIGAVGPALREVVSSVAPAVSASALGALRQLATVLPSVEQLRGVFMTAVSEAGMAVKMVANPEVVALLGGVGEAGKVVAASTRSALAQAAAAGANASEVAQETVTALANDAAAGIRVASAEATEALAKAKEGALEAAGNASQQARAAASAATATAAVAAAEARAAAALIKVKGMEAIANAPETASEAATAAQAAAREGLAQARVVASQLGRDVAALRVSAAEAMSVAAAEGQVIAAAAGEAATAAFAQGAAEAKVLASAAAASTEAAAGEAYDAIVAAVRHAPGVAAEALDHAREAGAAGAAASAELLEAGKAAAGPEVANAAAATVDAAKELRDGVHVGVSAGAAAAAAGARAAAAAAAAGAAAASGVLKEALGAAVEALPDNIVNELQTVLATAKNAGMQVFAAAAEVAQESVSAAIDAGRQLAPVVPAMASAAKAAGAAASTAATAAAGGLADASGEVASAVGPAAAVAGAALGEAVSEAGQAATAAGAYMADAGSAAASALAGAGREAAGAAADAAGAVGSALGGAAGEAKAGAVAAARAAHSGLAGAVGAGQSFFESGLAKGKDMVSWDAVDDAFAMSQEGLDKVKTALLAAGGGCFACFSAIGLDCIKFDIIRDFFQMVGLFFANIASESLAKAEAIWGNLSNLIAVDFSFVFPSISPLVIYIGIGIVAIALLVMFIVFMCITSSNQPDAIRDGHESEGWKEKAERQKKTVKFIRFFLQGCLSVYLPVSRSIFQILVCERTMAQVFDKLGVNVCTTDSDGNLECTCSDWEYYIYLQIASVVLLLGFTVAIPVKCYQLIAKNKPSGSRKNHPKESTWCKATEHFTFDEDGNKVPYTDQMYNRDMNTKPEQLNCPYLFLYQGYERRWAFYKVWVMVLKFLLCLPVIIFWDEPVLQTLVSLALLAIYAVASFKMSPFIDPHADRMDASARLTAMLVLFFAFMGSKDVWEGGAGVFGVFIQVVNFLNVFILILFTLLGLKCCRRRMKNTLGRFSFSDTCANTNGPGEDLIPSWDIDLEIKHRIWHAFWLSVLQNRTDEVTMRRFHDLRERVSDVGRTDVEKHFQAISSNPARVQQRLWVQQNLEGVDCYWDGPVQDGHNDSVSKFGKMYVNTFPFECVMVYDDCDDYSLLFEDQFDNFVAQNRSPDVVARRRNRQCVRALDGQMCHLEHSQMETHTVEDGTETYTDSEGRTHTRTRYTAVQVRMFYHNGEMGVSANTDRPMAAGFKAQLHYTDGHGVATAPHTGKQHQIRNSYTMPMSQFGMDDSFRMTPRLNELFSNNRPKIDSGLVTLHQRTQEYRAGLINERNEQEKIMSSGFWLFVFDNYKAPREAIEEYLKTREQNDHLKTLPTTGKAGLDFLYSRMEWVRAHPCASLWWLFFDDLWEQNKGLKVMEDKRELFDSRVSASLAYHPCKREELAAKMEEEGLRNLKGCRGSKKYFSDSLLDTLFTRLQQLDDKALNTTEDV